MRVVAPAARMIQTFHHQGRAPMLTSLLVPFQYGTDFGSQQSAMLAQQDAGMGGGPFAKAGGAGLAMTAVGAVSSAVGAYYSAQASKNSLKHQARMGKINAEISELGARSAMLQGQRKEQALRLGVANMKGTQRASYAARGVTLDSGSVQNTLNTTDYMGEVDALTIQSNTLQAAWGYRMGASNALSASSMARADASGISALGSGATSLLGSASAVAERWYAYQKLRV